MHTPVIPHKYRLKQMTERKMLPPAVQRRARKKQRWTITNNKPKAVKSITRLIVNRSALPKSYVCMFWLVGRFSGPLKHYYCVFPPPAPHLQHVAGRVIALVNRSHVISIYFIHLCRVHTPMSSFLLCFCFSIFTFFALPVPCCK